MLNRVATFGLGSRLIVLAVVLVVVTGAMTLVGTVLFQTDITTAVIAAVACIVATLAAHVAGEYPEGDHLIMARMAVQMVVRSALPFLVAVWGIYFADPPFEKSLVFYMILFYLAGLIADVQLSVARLKLKSGEVKQT